VVSADGFFFYKNNTCAVFVFALFVLTLLLPEPLALRMAQVAKGES
jgi:hypothetical protein